MRFRQAIFKGGVYLGGSQVFVQGCLFVQNLIVARMLGPSEYGIAASLTLTISILSMMTNVSTGRLMISDPRGNDESFQKTLQLFAFSKGALNALVLFVLADPLSRLFGIPEAVGAFRWVALYPLFGGLTTFDLIRMQKEMRFEAVSIARIGSAFTSLLFAYPVVLWRGDYTAIVILMFIKEIVGLTWSHMIAERTYGWAFEFDVFKKIFAFGWPLTMNGIILFLMRQGDRMLIATNMDKADLGLYSVGLALTMAPPQLVLSVKNPLFLPVFASIQNEPARFRRIYLLHIHGLVLVAAAIGLPFILGDDRLVVLLYGEEYAGLAGTIGWLAAMHCLRLIRSGPTMTSIAAGDTKNPLISNSVGIIGIGLAFIAVYYQAGLMWIAIARFVGEVVAIMNSVRRFSKVFNIPKMDTYVPAALGCIAMALGAGLPVILNVNSLWISLALFPLPVVPLLGTFLLLYPDFRETFIDLLSKFRLEVIKRFALGR